MGSDPSAGVLERSESTSTPRYKREITIGAPIDAPDTPIPRNVARRCRVLLTNYKSVPMTYGRSPPIAIHWEF